MKTFTAIVEQCIETGLYIGFVPGFSGAHTQAETLDELNQNLKEVIEMLLEDGVPALENRFVGLQYIEVA
jgi:predicted RNase H-like HicB family nuclease